MQPSTCSGRPALAWLPVSNASRRPFIENTSDSIRFPADSACATPSAHARRSATLSAATASR
eukprot:12409051-Prorocentrum_lima.AAC.1